MNLRQMSWLIVCVFVSVLVVMGIWAWSWNSVEDVTLRFATGPNDGTFYALGEEIRDLVHAADSTARIQLLNEKTDGSIDNVQRLSSGRADLAIVQNDTEPVGDIQTLIPLHRGVCHFLVPEDSEIESVYDLVGKRVAVGLPSSGNAHIVESMLNHFGVRFERFTPVREGIAGFREDLESGQIDAAIFITAITSPSLTKLIQGGRVRYVSLASLEDSNEVDGFAVTYPYIEKFVIPRYVYPVSDSRHGKPEAPCVSFALRSSLVCRGDLPDQVARTIVEAIVTNRAKLVRNNHDARDITEHFDPSDIQFPIHYGANAYYERQRPGFLERYAEPMAFMLSLFLAICGMAAAFNKYLTLRKKNRIDRYYERLDAMLDEINAPDASAERLESIEDELIAMRHDAVRELVNERLLADESFQIFQSLLTNCHQQISMQRSRDELPVQSKPV